MQTNKKYRLVIVWMRRALRVEDNHALFAATHDAAEVIPVLVLSNDKRYRIDTPRRRFVRSAILSLDHRLKSLGSQLFVLEGDPKSKLAELAERFQAQAVYAVSVYDPVALKRDEEISRDLKRRGCEFLAIKDRVIFEKQEILNKSGLPFRVYTPYRNAWLEKIEEIDPLLPNITSLCSPDVKGECDLDKIEGIRKMSLDKGKSEVNRYLMEFIKHKVVRYKESRDYPAEDGTSRLSAALSVGTISIRQVFWSAFNARKNADKQGRANIDTFIAELIWREFYYQILANFPHAAERSFRDEFMHLRWSTNEKHFAAWCEGRTGYPIVDAGMRQLRKEGWMHNRVRMIVASFLTKDLHINWQWGEKHFMEHLCDADVASNNGGWQWSAGTGTDAQPWFRVFNPITQGKKFDPNGDYVRKYVPELGKVPSDSVHAPWTMNRQEQIACGVIVGKDYPLPMVDHAQAREKTLALYKRGQVQKQLRPKRQFALAL